MRKRQLISWAAVLLWMALIFTLSHQPATESSQLSSGITEMVVTALENFIPDAAEQAELLQHIVRKNAHFMIYLVLGLLALNAVRAGGGRGIRYPIAALALCVVYAMSDEFHQLFIEGRSGEVRDVFIDSSGAAVGIVAFLLCSRLWKSKQPNKLNIVAQR
jgi:VanZ family protein